MNEQVQNIKERIAREYTYLKSKEVGSDEYNDSLERLNNLISQLNEIEKSEKDFKDRMFKNGIEIGKFVGGSIVMPIVGLVAILGFEKNDSFTTAMRGFVNYFLPKKM
jgi:hypothetical protein